MAGPHAPIAASARARDLVVRRGLAAVVATSLIGLGLIGLVTDGPAGATEAAGATGTTGTTGALGPAEPDPTVAWPDDVAGRLQPIEPWRAADTRKGLGGTILGAAEQRSFHLGEVPGVPEGAGGVVANLTVLGASTETHLVAYPGGSVGPPAGSNLNVSPGRVVSNLIVVPFGTGPHDGELTVFNKSGSVQVIIDVTGWLTAGADPGGGGLAGTAPTRFYDSRKSPAGPLAPGESRLIAFPYPSRTGVVNVTALAGDSPTHLTVWSAGTPRPPTSAVNAGAGEVRAAATVVTVGPGGLLLVRNNAGSTHVVLDSLGGFGVPVSPRVDATFVPLAPTALRAVDTRKPGQGPALGPGTVRTVDVTGIGEVPPGGEVVAAALTVTGTAPTASTHLTVWPADQARPPTSLINLEPGQTIANLTAVGVDDEGLVAVRNNSGSTHVVVDVVGYWVAGSPPVDEPGPLVVGDPGGTEITFEAPDQSHRVPFAATPRQLVSVAVEDPGTPHRPFARILDGSGAPLTGWHPADGAGTPQVRLSEAGPYVLEVRLGAIGTTWAGPLTLTTRIDEPEPEPGSQLAGCGQAGSVLVLTVDTHLDPACTYVGAEIRTSGVTLDCLGARILAPASPGPRGILIASDASVPLSDVTVRNCEVEGPYTNSIRVTRDGFKTLAEGQEYLDGFSDIRIERSWLHDSRGSGIFVDGYVTGVTISEVEIVGAGSVGIYLEAGSKGSVIEDSTITDNGYADVTPEGVPFEIGGVEYRYESTGREGIAVDGSRENLIRNNFLARNSAGGIFLYKNCGEYATEKPAQHWVRRYGADDNVIEHNVITEQGTGIWVGSRMAENQLFMDCSDPTYLESEVAAYHLDRAERNVVRDNVLRGVDHGIRVEDDDTTVERNWFQSGDASDLAVLVGTKWRTEVLGLPTAGTDLSGNDASLGGNRFPFQRIHPVLDTAATALTADGRPTVLTNGVQPPIDPFLFVKRFWLP